jgi:hypothetical protein
MILDGIHRGDYISERFLVVVDSVYYDRGDSGKYDRIGVWGVE